MLSQIKYTDAHDGRVQAAHAIIRRAEEIGVTPSRRWSWVELQTDEADYQWLRSWAAQLNQLDLQAVGNFLVHDHVPALGTPWAGLFTRSNVLMLPLVGLFAEILRRQEQDNEVWPRLVVAMDWPNRLRQMVGTGPARQDLCDAMRALATSLRMRHVYDLPFENAFKRHYHFLWLQAGAGCGWRGDQCLADWLVGLNLPDRIEMLRGTLHGDVNRSEDFLKAWECLRAVRRGNITDEGARKRLSTSCWFVGDPAEMVAAARGKPHAYDVDARAASIAATYDDGDPSDEEETASFFGSPVWKWEQGEAPAVEFKMQNLAGLADSSADGSPGECDYFVWLPADEQYAVKLLNQGGSFIVLGESEPRVLCAAKHLSPEIILRIGDQHGGRASWEAVRLWDPAAIATIVDLTAGAVVRSGKQPEAGTPCLVILQRSLSVTPAPDVRVEIAGGQWLLCRFATMPNEGVVVRDGEDEVWSSRAGALAALVETESLVEVESYESEKSIPAEPGGKVKLRVRVRPGSSLQTVTLGDSSISEEGNGVFSTRAPATALPRTLQLQVRLFNGERGRTIRPVVPIRVRGCLQMSGSPSVLRGNQSLNADGLAGEPLFIRSRLTGERERKVVEDEARSRLERERRHAKYDEDELKKFEAESEGLRLSLVRDLESKVANIVQRRTLLMEGMYGHFLLSTTQPVRGPLLGLGEELFAAFGPLNPQAGDRLSLAKAVVSTGRCALEPLECDGELLRVKLAGAIAGGEESAEHYCSAVLTDRGTIVETKVRFLKDDEGHWVEPDLPKGIFPARVVAVAVLYYSSVIGTAWRKDWADAVETMAEKHNTRRIIEFVRLFRFPILQREAKAVMRRVFEKHPLVWFEMCLAPGECRVGTENGKELRGARPLESERWRYAVAELSAAWQPTVNHSQLLIEKLKAGDRPLARAAESLLEIEPRLAGRVLKQFLLSSQQSIRHVLCKELYEKTESQMVSDHSQLRYAAAERVREITGAEDGDSVLKGLLALLRGNGDEQGKCGEHNWSVLSRYRDVGRFLLAAMVFDIGL